VYRLLRLLGDRTPLVVAILGAVIAARVLRRNTRTGGEGLDDPLIQGMLAIEAGLIAWAVWDELRRRRTRRS
jgi:hypothetical protein